VQSSGREHMTNYRNNLQTFCACGHCSISPRLEKSVRFVLRFVDDFLLAHNRPVKGGANMASVFTLRMLKLPIQAAALDIT